MSRSRHERLSDRRLKKLGDAIADDRRIDWDGESSDVPELRQEIRCLERLEALARAHRSFAATARGGTAGSAPPPVLFSWGPLEVLELIGRGSFGEVYRARDLRLRREVALKLRRAGETEEAAHTRRFLDEARSLARVRHPNVLVIHGADVHDGRVGFWTDFIRGETLAARMTEGGPPGPEEALLVGVALCRALAAVHDAGLVHGDVKAANVMRDDGGHIVLMDFGSASWPEAAAFPSGTPLVLAPEVLRGELPRPASDLYSLGVLLYQFTAGRYPVEAKGLDDLREKHAEGRPTPLRDLRPDLPAEFVGAVERALSPEPESRFASAEEMEEALLAALPPAATPAGEAQTLSSLLDEIGLMPEVMCRRIGREAAAALARIHGAGQVHGDLGADCMLVRKAGGVRLLRPTGAPPRRGGAPGLDAHQRADLRRLGDLLHEAVTGQRLGAGGAGAGAGAGAGPGGGAGASAPIGGSATPFFQAVVEWLRGEDPAAPPITAREVAQVLADGERSAWWRERARAFRLRTRPLLRRIRISRETALHGRDHELAWLRAAYERARSGEGQVVLLDGEAGIGKTRLVDDMVGALERDGEEINFLVVSYPPGGAATATGAFLAAYREHLGEERLDETLADYLAAAPGLIAPFAALLLGEGEGADPGRLTTDSLQAAFIHVTRALAAERPAIVFVDDLHFAPQEGRGLFAALALAARGHRLLLVGGARPGLPEDWTAGILRLEHSSRLALARLTRRDVVRILAEALGSEHLAEDLAPEMTQRSDGNPLFLFESLHAMEESGRMVRDAGGVCAITGALEDLPTPESIQHLIRARLAGLDEEDKGLLEVACCAGFEFDPVFVAQAAGLEALPALKRFALIEKRHGLIHAAERHYVFDHHQVQEALHEGLMIQLRERFHVALAEALEREHVRELDPKDVDGAIAVSLCEHYFRGGRGRDGLRYLRRSLDQLGSVQPSATLALVDRALSVPGLVTGSERFELLDRKTSLIPLLGNRAEERASHREMVLLADEIGRPAARVQSRRKLAFSLIRMGQVEEAQAVLEEAETLARAGGDALEEARVALARGSLALHRSRGEEALAFLARSRHLARQVGNRRIEAQIIGTMGLACLELRRLDEAQKHSELSLSLMQAEGDKAGEMIAIGNLAAVILDGERYEEALALLERHLALARESGMRLGETYATANLGLLFSALGRIGEALAFIERSLKLSREFGNRIPEIENLERLGTALAMLGRHEEARAHFERSLAIAREIQNSRLEGNALVGLGGIAEQSGDLGAAEDFYRRAEGAWNAIRATSDLPHVILRLGCLFRISGRIEEAQASLHETVVRARESRCLKLEVLALAHLALLPGGDAGEARERFMDCERRLPLVTKMEARFLLWKATGDRSHLEAAAGLLAALRDRAPQADREGLALRVPLYREIAAAAAATTAGL